MRRIICRAGVCYLDKLPASSANLVGSGKMKFGSGGFNPRAGDYGVPLIKTNRPTKAKKPTTKQTGKGKGKKRANTTAIKGCGAGSSNLKPKKRSKAAPKKKLATKQTKK